MLNEIKRDIKITEERQSENISKKISQITDCFKRLGFSNVKVYLKDFNIVEVNFFDVSEEKLQHKIAGTPLLAFIGRIKNHNGQSEYMPVPISEYHLNMQLLDKALKYDSNLEKQTFYLISDSDKTLEKAFIYRKLYGIQIDFYKIPYQEREKFDSYFKKSLKDAGLDFYNNLIQYVIKTYQLLYKNNMQLLYESKKNIQ